VNNFQAIRDRVGADRIEYDIKCADEACAKLRKLSMPQLYWVWYNLNGMFDRPNVTLDFVYQIDMPESTS